MAQDQSWIADLLNGYRTIQIAGVPVSKQRNILNILSGATAADNPANLSTDLTIAGGGGSFTAANDLSGSSSTQTVIGIKSKALPSLPVTDQYLHYTGSAWAFTALPTAFSAGGDLSGSATSQTVAGIMTKALPALPGTDQYLHYTGSAWQFSALPAALSVTGTGLWYSASGSLNAAAVTMSGDATMGALSGSNLPVTLATVNSNVGMFGDSTHVAQITVNAKGLVTAVSNVATGGGTSAPLTFTRRTNTANATYTIDSTGGGADCVIYHNKSGAVSYVLPAPTDGRQLEMRDLTGSINTLANNVFLVPHAGETINGSAGFAMSGTAYHFTNGSSAVTATSSKFQSELAVGMSVLSSNQAGVNYIVTAIASDTSLTISPTFGGTTTTTATSTRTSLTFAANNGTLYIVSDGTNWTIKGDGTPTVLTYITSSGGTVAPVILPQGVSTLNTVGCGAGGGGGGAGGNWASVTEGSPMQDGGFPGAGGGSALLQHQILTLTPMTAYAVVIGAGGIGGAGGAGSASSPVVGSDGGSGMPTTLGTILQFLGASGGQGGNRSNALAMGGMGWTLGTPSSNSDTTKNIQNFCDLSSLTNTAAASRQTGLQCGGVAIVNSSPISLAGNPAVNQNSTSSSAGGAGSTGSAGGGSLTQTDATGGGGGGAMGPFGSGGNGGGGGGAAAGTSGGIGGAAGTGGNGGSAGSNATTTAGAVGGAGGAAVANSGGGGGGGGGSGNSANSTTRTGGAGGAGASGQLIGTYVL